MERLYREFMDDSKRFDGDLIGPKAMRRYFELYFFARKDEMVYMVGQNSAVGRNDNLLSLLSDNRPSLISYAQANPGKALSLPIVQSFMTAAKSFEAIDSNTRGAIVPYREGKRLVLDILETTNPEVRREAVKKAQRYSVNLFKWQIEKLSECGALREIGENGIYSIDSRYYSNDFGIDEAGKGKLEFLNL
jgi:CRISPR-associated endonuclease/helicase Cas3